MTERNLPGGASPSVCKRCLLSDFDPELYFQTVREYIQSLPEKAKVTESEYRRRLAICMQCHRLINGLCAECGCFVEVRAIKQNMHCAQSQDRW